MAQAAIGHYMMTSFTLFHFGWNRANHCAGTIADMSQVGGRKSWQSATVVNSTLVVDPAIQLPGFDLHRRKWSLLNRFQTGQGHCGACHKKWGFIDSELCGCGEVQTPVFLSGPAAYRSHIVNSCPLTKFHGGLLRLHEANEAAVDWLTAWLLAHDNNKLVRPRWPYDMRPSARAEKYMCVIVIR